MQCRVLINDVDLVPSVANRGAARGPLLLRLGLCFDDDGRGLRCSCPRRVLELFNLLAEPRELVAVGGARRRAQLQQPAARPLGTPGSARRALASGIMVVRGAGRRGASVRRGCALSAAAARARVAWLSVHRSWLASAGVCVRL